MLKFGKVFVAVTGRMFAITVSSTGITSTQEA